MTSVSIVMTGQSGCPGAVSCWVEGHAPGLIPTRRVRGSGACSGSRRDPDGPCCRPSCIRRIARESITYQDESPYLYHKMLWSRYNEDTTSCVSMWLLRCIWA